MNTGTLIAFVVLAATALPATQAAPLVVTPIAPAIQWIQGGAAGNTGFLIGKNGIIAIDTTMTADGAKATLAEIAKVSSKPVTHVILTHGDADDTGGLAAFPVGVTVIAHEGAKRDLEAAAATGGRAALPRNRLPSRYISGLGESVDIDGVKISFHHWAPAHTNGDMAVYLPDSKVIYTGDLISTDLAPAILLNRLGSSEGWITSVKGLLGLGATQFVPGHGDALRTPAEIQARLSAAAAKRDRIVALVREGKSLDEIKTAAGEPPGARGPAQLTFTDVVYQELTRRTKDRVLGF